jgi:hypothetical protein
MGGPAEMALGWPLVAVFTMTVALSIFDGGGTHQYRWPALINTTKGC